MTEPAASALCRGRVSLIDEVTLAFLQRAQRLAVRRAARDAHRAECRYDALDCPTCQEHARAIADAKQALRNTP